MEVIDAHVHFWDSGGAGNAHGDERLQYDWLRAVPALERPFLPSDYAAASGDVRVERIVFVEANCRPDQTVAEVSWIDRLSRSEPRIAAVVAHADLMNPRALGDTLDRLQQMPLVRGIRHNVQGQPRGFCLQTPFVDGVREAGRRGLTFDICATHDQLDEVAELARLSTDTRLVLDHCGKPAIARGWLDPWRTHIADIAACGNVWCKLSGLLTEAHPARRSDADLSPFVEHVIEQFGTTRLMFGSDWPVLTLAGNLQDWHAFTCRLTGSWSRGDRRRFHHDNANEFYGLGN